MQRELKPELLDSLQPDDPAALHNRRDLRLINRVQGNHRWLMRTLAERWRPGEPILEIGAGTGELAGRLSARGKPTDGLDLWPVPSDWPPDRRWHQADLMSFDGYADYPVLIGNLIFHQFEAGQLAELGQRLRRSARLILACEPMRRRSSQVLYRALGPLLGANYVSLHDAHASIAAGFRVGELANLLGLAEPAWAWRCHSTVLGTVRMVAWRV